MARTHAFAFPLILSAMMVAGASVAAGLSGAEAAQARMDHMKALGGAMKAIHEQLKTGAPDIAVVKDSAAKLVAGAAELPTWFPAGSGKDAFAKSRALPAVWTDATGFAAKAEALRTAAAQMNADAQAGNVAAFDGDIRGLGMSCKGCHDGFQEKEPPKAS